MVDHMISNLSDRQFGFIMGRTAVIQLLCMLDEWTEYIDSGNQIDCIKVPHKKLISKLPYYNFHPDIIIWINSCLCHRQQRVMINGLFSKRYSVLSVIPQGSILGTLLYLVYVNDLPEIWDSNGNESQMY